MGKSIMSVFNGQNGRASGANVSDPEATAVNPAPVAPARSVMTLGRTLTFKGELSADEDLVLLGRVEGSITHSESLTVGVGGVVIGDLRARVIIIKGTVEGDIEASESITVSPNANVLGDLVAPRVSVVEGAIYNGIVRMTRTAAADVAQTPATDEVLRDKAVDQMLASR